MTSSSNLDQMTPDQLRALAAQLQSKVDTMGRKIHCDETIIEQLSHDIAILKRHKFAKRSKQITLAQGSLLVVEQHVRGKWACRQCETLIQAPLPAQVIDKGIPTAGLLAHVMLAKFSDHLPLYRQEKIFGRAGLAIPRSTLAQWVGQTGVQLQPSVDALRDAVLVENCNSLDQSFPFDLTRRLHRT